MVNLTLYGQLYYTIIDNVENVNNVRVIHDNPSIDGFIYVIVTDDNLSNKIPWMHLYLLLFLSRSFFFSSFLLHQITKTAASCSHSHARLPSEHFSQSCPARQVASNALKFWQFAIVRITCLHSVKTGNEYFMENFLLILLYCELVFGTEQFPVINYLL